MMNSTFTLANVFGILSHEFGDNAPRRMAVESVRLVKSLYADDSLSVESSVGRVDSGRVPIKSTGLNQHGEAIVELAWSLPLQAPSIAELLANAATDAPLLDADRSFATLAFAPAFEDFTVGSRIDHGTGRTLLRDESVWMALLSMRQGGHYVDLAYASADGLRDILVDEGFVLATVLGLGVKHSTQAAVANLGWQGIRFHHPVYPNDTIYSESVVTGARESSSRPGQGIVSLHTIGRNQRDEVVLSYDRSFLTYRRDARPAGL